MPRPVQPGSPAPPAPPRVPYRNPFRAVKGLQAERVDMGVDYAGTGPVYALGPGRITNIWNTGWNASHGGVDPGAFIGERITAGPLKGRYVYVAEGIYPSVKVGQQVDSTTVIGRMFGGGIETGFAEAPGTGNALGASQFSGSNSTAYGAAYSKILHDLGAPAGILQNKPTGQNPNWIERILKGGIFGLGGVAAGDVASSAGGVAGALSSIGQFFSDIATSIDWLFQPSNWLRVIAGVMGGGMVLSGVVVLTHVGAQIPVPGVGGSVSARPAALPIGILLVGGGGVLLFIAFHNLPGSPANVTELLGSARGAFAAAAAGQPSGVTQPAESTL